jgi:nitrite reductase/ring-hydroxylating ferredoxin subunit
MDVWHVVAEADAVAEEEALAVSLEGRPIALFRQGEELFALHDLCSHGNARLSDGFVENCSVECPLHQGRFDLRTGAALCAPLTEGVRSYPVRVVDGRVEVAV